MSVNYAELDENVFVKAREDIDQHGWWFSGAQTTCGTGTCLGLAVANTVPWDSDQNTIKKEVDALADRIGAEITFNGVYRAIYIANDARRHLGLEEGKVWALGVLDDLIEKVRAAKIGATV